jgi:hypothetical protein
MLWTIERDCILMSCIYTIYALLLTSSLQSGSIYWHRKCKKAEEILMDFFTIHSKNGRGGMQNSNMKKSNAEKESCSKFK